MPHPEPSTLYPLPHYVRLVYLKNCITNPNITIGDYTYYDDPAPLEFEKQAVLYHFDFIGDRLIIGKFCAIASGVKFIMNGANHATSGFSTYPFGIFGCGWEGAMEGVLGSPHKGDTVVGNDVWIGYGTTILPGITIGDGAIIAALSVVTKDVAPYEVVGGNPAKVIKKRFDEETIALLLALQWWEREPEWIAQHLSLLYGCDLKALRSLL